MPLLLTALVGSALIVGGGLFALDRILKHHRTTLVGDLNDVLTQHEGKVSSALAAVHGVVEEAFS